MGYMNDLSLFRKLAIAARMQSSEVKISKSGFYGRSNLDAKQAYRTVTEILGQHDMVLDQRWIKVIGGNRIIIGQCFSIVDQYIIYFVFTECGAGTFVSVSGVDYSDEEGWDHE